MKVKTRGTAIGVKFEALEARRMLALSAELLQDTNTQPTDAIPWDFVKVGSTAYFFANDATHGFELWKSNGTTVGTNLVKDIFPGVASSNSLLSSVDNPAAVALNGMLVFGSNDGVHGHELWVSDGTEAGTTLLADINPGAGDALPRYTTAMNGFAYFAANTSGSATQLWRTDGTAAGTSMVANLPAVPVSSASTFIVVGNSLFFGVINAGGTGLYKTDGTPAGTVLVKIVPRVSNAIASGNLLAFTNAGQLWTSDGTAVKTLAVAAAPPGVTGLIAFNNAVYISAPLASGDAIYKITAAGVSTLIASPAHGRISSLTLLDANTLLFTTTETTVNGGPNRLFGIDGPTNALTQLADLGTMLNRSAVSVFGVSATLHEAYLRVPGILTGNELWVTDGTVAGSGIVADLNPGTGAGALTGIVDLNGQILFGGSDGPSKFQLWATDGTAANTTLVKTINVVGTDSAVPAQFFDAGSKLYFLNNDGVHGFELWVSGGTDATTSMVTDLAPGIDNGTTYILGAVNGLALFASNVDGNGMELWVSDGTAVGTQLLFDINPGAASSNLFRGITIGNQVYFEADDGNGDQIWVSDGTVNGTHAVTSLPGNLDVFKIIGALNGRLVFIETPGGPGVSPTPQMYITDGATVQQLSTGNIKSTAIFFKPVVIGNTLYFDAISTGSSATILYRTDGTPGGTVPVTSNSGPTPIFLTKLNGLVYFVFVDQNNRSQLWKSDGTASGTVSIRTFDFITNLTSLNGELIFEARVNAGETNTKIWVSDGTNAGSHQLIDINPGSFNSPGLIGVIGNTGYFSADDGIHGVEPWITDGTLVGTYAIDVHPGLEASSPRTYTAWGSSLIFAADDGVHGIEPMIIRIPPKVLNASFDAATPAHAIRVQFNANVAASVNSSALIVKRITGNTATETSIDPASISVAYDALTNTAIITFPGLTDGSLPNGNYSLTLKGSAITDILGTHLDGLGTGTAGTDYLFNFIQNSQGGQPLALSGNVVYLKKDVDEVSLDVWIDSITPGVGVPTQKMLLSAINGVTFNGGVGDDSLIVDYKNGPLGISLADNASLSGANSLRIIGTTGIDTLTASAGGIAFSSSLAGFTPVVVSMSHVQTLWMAGGGGGNDSINLTGGTYTLDADTPTGTPNVGVTVGATAIAKFDSDQHLANLTLNGGSANLSTVRHSMYLNGLSITNNGLLDIANSFLYLNTIGTSFATARLYLDAGYNLHGVGNLNAPLAGDYNGPSGITSSIAKTSYASDLVVGLGIYNGALQDPANPDTVGQILGPDSNSGHGTGIPLNQILIRPTLTGDLNGDGVVNAYDVNLFNSYGLFNTGSTPLGWQAGDLNGDGVVDSKDVTVFNTVGNFNVGAFPPPPVRPSIAKRSSRVSTIPSMAGSLVDAHRGLNHSDRKSGHKKLHWSSLYRSHRYSQTASAPLDSK